MTAERIARALGGRRCGRGWVCRCPAHEDRTPSLSLADGNRGRQLVKCFAGCDAREVLAELRRRGLLDDRGDRRELALPRPKPAWAANDNAGRTAAALKLWYEARDPRGTVAETYLAGRGLALDADLAGRVLRYHPACPFGAGPRQPCMIALYRDLRTDAPRAIHRTALALDGTKLGRKMLGPCAGAAVKLDAHDSVELGLVVAEGIETALAGRKLGFRPCWALGSAGAIGALPLLGGIEGLTVLGENDPANAAAVRKCLARWNTHADVAVIEPLGGKDLNDSLRGSR